MKVVDPDPQGLATAAAALHAGLVVAYPTETVYGLAVDPFSAEALDRLFSIKGRPEAQSVLLLVGNEAQLLKLCQSPSVAARACMAAYWPGPLSLVLPAAGRLPEALLGPGNKVCARHSSSPVATALCLAFGAAITSTSANKSGEEAPNSLESMHLDGIAVAIDGGVLPPSAPSTVYDPDERRIIRQGVQDISDSMLGVSR